jgi:hypothetical protein
MEKCLRFLAYYLLFLNVLKKTVWILLNLFLNSELVSNSFKWKSVQDFWHRIYFWFKFSLGFVGNVLKKTVWIFLNRFFRKSCVHDIAYFYPEYINEVKEVDYWAFGPHHLWTYPDTGMGNSHFKISESSSL